MGREQFGLGRQLLLCSEGFSSFGSGTAVGVLNGTLREQSVYCVFAKGVFRAKNFEASQ